MWLIYFKAIYSVVSKSILSIENRYETYIKIFWYLKIYLDIWFRAACAAAAPTPLREYWQTRSLVRGGASPSSSGAAPCDQSTHSHIYTHIYTYLNISTHIYIYLHLHTYLHTYLHTAIKQVSTSGRTGCHNYRRQSASWSTYLHISTHIYTYLHTSADWGSHPDAEF